MPIILRGYVSNYVSLTGTEIQTAPLLLQLSIHSNVSENNAQSGLLTAPTELWAKMLPMIAWTVFHKYFVILCICQPHVTSHHSRIRPQAMLMCGLCDLWEQCHVDMTSLTLLAFDSPVSSMRLA
eukprot:scaffold54324_cov37-Prasinocladus_malaysianus.AAC.3